MDPDDIVEKAIFHATAKQHVSEKSQYTSNMHQTYHIVMGQCTQNVINHLKALMENRADMLLLIVLLKKLFLILRSRRMRLIHCSLQIRTTIFAKVVMYPMTHTTESLNLMQMSLITQVGYLGITYSIQETC